MDRFVDDAPTGSLRHCRQSNTLPCERFPVQSTVLRLLLCGMLKTLCLWPHGPRDTNLFHHQQFLWTSLPSWNRKSILFLQNPPFACRPHFLAPTTVDDDTRQPKLPPVTPFVIKFIPYVPSRRVRGSSKATMVPPKRFSTKCDVVPVFGQPPRIWHP